MKRFLFLFALLATIVSAGMSPAFAGTDTALPSAGRDYFFPVQSDPAATTPEARAAGRGSVTIQQVIDLLDSGDVGLANVDNVKHLLSAGVPPMNTNDSDSNWSVGSFWFMANGTDYYRCSDASVGAAVWDGPFNYFTSADKAKLDGVDEGANNYIHPASHTLAEISDAGTAAAASTGDFDVAGASATVQGNLDTHTADVANPHGVTAAQVGADPAGTVNYVHPASHTLSEISDAGTAAAADTGTAIGNVPVLVDDGGGSASLAISGMDLPTMADYSVGGVTFDGDANGKIDGSLLDAAAGATAIADLTDWPAGLTAAEIGYSTNVTSDIQAQIDGIVVGSPVTTAPTFRDDACTTGQYAFSGDGLTRYDCVATNLWFTSSLTNSLSDAPTTPTLTSIDIDTLGTTLTLTGSESLSIGAGGNAGFDLDCVTAGLNIVPTYVSGAPGTALVYSIPSTVYTGDTCDLDYTQPVDGIESTAAGVDLVSFGNAVATNGSTVSAPTPPTLTSATVDSAGTSLTLVFSEAVTRGAGFAITDIDLDASITGANLALTLTGATGDGTATHVYPLATATIVSGETVDIDFNGAADSLEDAAGDDLAAIVDGAVTNASTASGGASLLYWDGSSLTVNSPSKTAVAYGTAAVTVGGPAGSYLASGNGGYFSVPIVSNDIITPETDGRITFKIRYSASVSSDRVLIHLAGASSYFRAVVVKNTNDITFTYGQYSTAIFSGVTPDVWHDVELSWTGGTSFAINVDAGTPVVGTRNGTIVSGLTDLYLTGWATAGTGADIDEVYIYPAGS